MKNIQTNNRIHNLSKETRGAYASRFKSFCSWLDSEEKWNWKKFLEDPDAVLAAYINHLEREGSSQKVARNMLTAIATFFKGCKEKGPKTKRALKDMMHPPVRNLSPQTISILKQWFKTAGISRGPVFLRIRRQRTVMPGERLAANSAHRRIKARAGVPSSSLRRGQLGSDVDRILREITEEGTPSALRDAALVALISDCALTLKEAVAVNAQNIGFEADGSGKLTVSRDETD